METKKRISRETVCFWIILVLGAGLRLFYLGVVPGGMHQDESLVAWNAYGILHEGMDAAGNRFPVYMADWGDGHSALYTWLILPFLALHGGSLSPVVSRLPQALTGIFTIAAVYVVGREIWNRRTGLWISLMLAICPWHIMMCRWGLDANIAPGFLIFGLCFFLFAVNTSDKKRKHRYLLLSAFFYGLSLYGYAVIWPMVPVMLLLQTGYALWNKKLIVDGWSVLAGLLLFIMALPLLLFVMVNQGILQEIRLPFMTIPKMPGYRGGEVATGFAEMYAHLRTALSLLWHQNTGAPYDILLPWGLFYDIGRIFIVAGVLLLLFRVIRSLIRRQYSGETFLLIQLVGGGLVCLLVAAVLHQINALYIPLVICEGFAVSMLTEQLEKRLEKQLGEKPGQGLKKAPGIILLVVYGLCLIGFQRDYYTEYRTTVGAWFGQGIEECVEYALEVCENTDIKEITVEKGAQWPRLLLYTQTLPSQYLGTVEYDVAPAPASFCTEDGILIRTRIDYTDLSDRSVYIIYSYDVDTFSRNYELTGFYDWYVAVPKAVQ